MPLTEAPVVGKDCKLYLNAATHATPTWTEVKSAINVSANLGKGEADVSARFSGWKLTKGALKELEISCTYRHKSGADTVFDALLDAYINDTPLEFAVLDAAVTESGAQGPRAFCEILSLNLTQELENAAEYELTVNRTWSTAISVNAIRRVKELVGINLLEVFDGEMLAPLADDPVLLVNTLYAVCKPQADERDVSDEAFGELLVGDTIELAAAALVRGIADFFPKDRRAVLDRLWAATRRTRSEAIQMATDKLDSPLVEQAITGAIRKASDEIDQRLRSFFLWTPI
jgi:hypothetical protein